MMASFASQIIGFSVGLAGLVIAVPVLAQSPPLEQQLNMRRQEFERAQELQKAQRFMERADRQLALGQEEAAIAAWQQAADIYSSVGDLPNLQAAIEPLTKTLIAIGRYSDAEIVIRQQLTLAQTQRDRVGQMYALNNLGVLYLQQGQLERATAALATALDLAEALPDDTGIGLSLSNLGLAARLADDLAAARNYYESAIQYRRAATDWVGVANSSNSLAAIYRQLSDDDRALELYLAAREAALIDNHTPTLLTALDGMIGVYADLGDIEALEAAIAERTTLTPPLAPSEQQLGLYIGLGRYYEQLEDYPRAQAAYDQALAITEDIGAGAAAQRTFILQQLQGVTLLMEAG
ncbi:MAG: tetratricopeptide repeat protein [Leptolyngbya sp. SIOISBB]|nr:tetratricopeptide repeat protein [Leptolyngbya sp. SIOISBB]